MKMKIEITYFSIVTIALRVWKEALSRLSPIQITFGSWTEMLEWIYGSSYCHGTTKLEKASGASNGVFLVEAAEQRASQPLFNPARCNILQCNRQRDPQHHQLKTTLERFRKPDATLDTVI